MRCHLFALRHRIWDAFKKEELLKIKRSLREMFYKLVMMSHIYIDKFGDYTGLDTVRIHDIVIV